MNSTSYWFRLGMAAALGAAGCVVGCAAPQSAPPAMAPATPPVAALQAAPASVPPVPAPAGTVLASPPAAPPLSALSPPVDEKAVASATGAEKAETSADGIVRVTFPRKDVEVVVDGWKMPPFMGLTSWVGFAPGRAGVAEAMIMGDLVLFEDEVNPVLSTLLDGGVQVTALHNHFFFDSPHVYFMHVGGEGSVAALGKGVREALGKIAEIRKRTPKPNGKSGSAPLPAKSTIDAAKIGAILEVKGQSKDGMFKATMGRKATASCGCSVGKSLGVATWAAFAGSDDNAVVDGDFSVSEVELQQVLATLRAGGINIVAIHHHMSGEVPRLLFLHYWGRGKAVDLATTIKKALDHTGWDHQSA